MCGGSILWHDYYESAPYWVGVKRYVDGLDLDLARVDNTWLALAQIGNNGALDILDSTRIV
jgi:hypothetical protein